jgi:hypothetical protein
MRSSKITTSVRSKEQLESTVRDLERELYFARQGTIDLMPAYVRDVLMTLYGCRSRQDAFEWRDRTVQVVVALAEKTAEADRFNAPDRAFCPLCNGGSSAPGQRGYALPAGLRRHLLGELNMSQCVVMRAAFALAFSCAEDPSPKLRE